MRSIVRASFEREGRRPSRVCWLLALCVLARPCPASAQPPVDPPSASEDQETPDRPPAWLSPAPAAWPQAEPAGEPREVELAVVIDESGAVSDASVASEGVPEPFAQAALAFVRTQHFAPALHDGRPVSARVHLRVRFEPPAPEPPAPVAPPAPAPPPPPPPPSAPDSAAREDYGARAQLAAGAGKARAVSSSDLRIEVGALHDVPRQDSMQLLTLAPGVVLTNHAGEGHAYAVFLRGFDAGEGQDLEVRVAGMPINEPSNAHGHGYADTHFVAPELVHTVRMLEGPFDARQGDFAAAGTAEFELAASEPGVRAQASLGSYGRRRVLVTWSPSQATRETFAAVDLTDGEGFGPNRAHGNVRALGQFAGRARRLDYRLLAGSHALQFDSAGVVREDAVESGNVTCGSADVAPFYCLHDPNQGGQAARHFISARLGARLPGAEWSQQLTLMLRRSRFRENFTGALLDERGDGLDQQTSTTTLVASGHYRVETAPLRHTQVFELGYEGRYDLGESRMWRVRRDGQIPYDTVFDQELALSRVSLYALGELTFTPWLRAELGVRSDTYGYDVLDRDQPTQDREGERLPAQSVNAWGTNVQPRATLSLGPFAGLSWLTSFGLGSRSSDAAALSEGETAPFTRIWAGESGLVYEARARSLGGEARAAFFYAHVDEDLLFDETRGRNVPVGATNRYGAYAYGRMGLGELLDSSASFTWAEAYMPPEGTSFAFASGPRLPFVPRFVARGDVSARHAIPTRWDPVAMRAGVGTTWVSPRPLPLDVLGHAIFTLDTALSARFRMFELTLEGTNLTDRQNRSAEFFYASDFDTGGPTQRRVRHFSAAPPRQFMATLAIIFDPTPHQEQSP